MYSLTLHRAFHAWYRAVRCGHLRAWVHRRVIESQVRLQRIEAALDCLCPTAQT